MRRGLLAVLALCACSSKTKPAQEEHDPQLVEVAAEATSTKVLAGEPAALAVRVRVSAGGLPSAKRPPLDLVIVLDTSGSMAGEPIAAARAAAADLIARLGPDDRVGVVAFDSRARVVLPTVRLSPVARVWAQMAIRRLEAHGTTDLAGGLALGLQLIEAGRQPDSVDRIVLVSDGVPNDEAALPSLIAQARQARVSVTTLGLGVEFDEALLGVVALDTGGAYHFVDEPATVATVFDEEIVRMRQAIARNVVVTLSPGPGVTLEFVPGVEASGAARVAWLGDLAAGEVRDVIIPLGVVARKDGAAVELVDVAVTWEDAALGRGAQSREAYVAATATRDAAAVLASVKLPLEVARRRAAAASAILEAIRRARGGDVAGGLAVLDAAEKETRAAAAELADVELGAFADRMQQLRRSLAQIAVASLDTLTQQQSAPAAAEPTGAGSAAPRTYNVAEDRAVEVEMRKAHEEANTVLRSL